MPRPWRTITLEKQIDNLLEDLRRADEPPDAPTLDDYVLRMDLDDPRSFVPNYYLFSDDIFGDY